MAKATTLARSISPPSRRKSTKSSAFDSPQEDSKRSIDVVYFHPSKNHTEVNAAPTLAAIEAGEARIQDHLDYFSKHLRQAIRPSIEPSLSIEQFGSLYARNQHQHGRHFVVHQHDHPISGISVACTSLKRRLTREAASHGTGSLLIWDIGEYEVLPYKESRTRYTDDELSDGRPTNSFERLSQNERLFRSFQRKRIRLRLHGTHLPPNYTISMWLPSANDRTRQPKRPKRKRRRVDPAVLARWKAMVSSSDDDIEEEPGTEESSNAALNDEDEAAGAASDHDEDATIRANNAYPGAVNTIGSIHQRNWILTLDKKNSGFRKARSGPNQGRWVGNSDPFFVRGRDYERSIVTGRSADDVMDDESVEKFVGRKMWRPIIE